MTSPACMGPFLRDFVRLRLSLLPCGTLPPWLPSASCRTQAPGTDLKAVHSTMLQGAGIGQADWDEFVQRFKSECAGLSDAPAEHVAVAMASVDLDQQYFSSA